MPSRYFPLKLWWWSLDRTLFWVFVFLLCMGSFLVFSVGPVVAAKHGWSPLLFVKKHYAFAILGLGLMMICSTLRKSTLFFWSLVILVLSVLLLAGTLTWGTVIKGGRRWIHLPLMGTFQPSEFVKPSLILVTAWLLQNFPIHKAFVISGVVIGTIGAMLLRQPDVGMTVLILGVWIVQIFYAGIPLRILMGMGCLGFVGFGIVFMTVPHVSRRISQFFCSDALTQFDGHYQVLQSLQGFRYGGFWGQGPGASRVKHTMPDAHTDFIFSVGIEELGIFFGLSVLIAYGFVVFAALAHGERKTCLFQRYALVGLSVQLGLQVFINLGSVMKLIPPKGMTLPFISYGGSALLSSAWMAGCILALTHRYEKPGI